MKKFISSAYVYPVCPISIDHARMFLVGDIIARYYRANGNEVYFPIASHYSGNTAQNISKVFIKYFSRDINFSVEEKKIIDLYKDFYGVQTNILKSFVNPMNILNFYNQETLKTLKSLNISGDYENVYTTEHKDFYIFINTVISFYEKNNLLIYNKNRELALDYDNNNWKNKINNLINQTIFIQKFHKNNILSAINNIRNDWGFLREKNDGFGVKYKDEWIIDPMFDSELFTIFDLYIKFKNKYIKNSLDTEKIFINLFDTLINQADPESDLVKDICKWLPCDVFICEEHLKNWVVKKMFAESALINNIYQTKKYFILGMGLKDGLRMSSSKGTAILANNLINSYGGLKARLIILICGGHPSKTYNYDNTIPAQADLLISNFINYYIYLISIVSKEFIIQEIDKDIIDKDMVDKIINKKIIEGYYREVIIELLSVFPKKYKFPNYETASFLLSFYDKYLGILLPNLLKDFNYNLNK